ncbi:hypothetical protein JY651_11435 [Pyxidicoccus parkwayensis]|uniref:Uncharacterized protein n=1 Tax=Pyxidicoccus parkwayensis TaxID=2813578 RepID=A0ABX7P4U8_9BACT|nr:hypothetical protein [Pyxidicoccus parkwaysis]QSQ25498.1 hypothetical protein JY651_11435 [Pyxidicoccus parkwaysis]
MSTALLFAVVVGAAGVLGVRWWRSMERGEDLSRCDRCGKARVLLDEETEDAHLDEGQQHEERLGTADYHVWWCESCERGRVVRHALEATRRRVECEKCGHDAAQEVMKTVAAATHVKGGELQVRLSCGGCGHTQQFVRYTPRVRTP